MVLLQNSADLKFWGHSDIPPEAASFWCFLLTTQGHFRSSPCSLCRRFRLLRCKSVGSSIKSGYCLWMSRFIWAASSRRCSVSADITIWIFVVVSASDAADRLSVVAVWRDSVALGAISVYICLTFWLRVLSLLLLLVWR